MSITEKTAFLNELTNFIDEQKFWLENTLKSIGWNVTELEKLTENTESELVPCTVDPNHRVLVENLQKHEEKCEKKHGQYPEITDTLDYEFFQGYAVIMNYLGWIINEKKSNFLIGDLSDETLSINDEQNQNTKRKEQQQESSKYLMELLAAERDAKRRRAAHRGKRVHSNKKSYNEILREVITNQMETLEGVNTEDNKYESDKVECSQKDLIQPRVENYLGLGGRCYNGNPYKRWLSIEKEEQELINEMKKERDEKHNHSSRDGEFFRSSKNYEKSLRDSKYDRKYSYRDNSESGNYERFKKTDRFCDNHNTQAGTSKERSRYHEHHDEKYSESKYKSKSKKKHEYDSDSDSHSSKKHKNKHKSSHKRSHHKSRYRDSKT